LKKQQNNSHATYAVALKNDVLSFIQPMTVTADFQIISNTGISGVVLVQPMSEDAFSYLQKETDLSTLLDGSAPLATEKIDAFKSDAEHAHLWCAAV
jgi:hypothetical protein